jgi:peptidoglycan hydrolase CwlO-like protein
MSPETTLEAKVTKFKLIARDALRMKLISPRLSTIAGLETDMKELEDCQKTNEHKIVVENYEIGKMDKDHPDYAEDLKDKQDEAKYAQERVDELLKDIAEVQKAITEQKDGIAKIESGETKVCLEDLNELVDKLVREDAYNQVQQ